MKRAVVVLIETVNEKFVMVSRKDNPNDFGLPGGKVDRDEEELRAAVREVKEEIGLDIYEEDLELIFTEDCNGYKSSTYHYRGNPVDVNTLTSEEDGIIAEGIEELYSDTSTFSVYNKKLLKKLKYIDFG